MSSGKKHKPWNDRVHESVVSRNKSGQLNLVIKGGAEEAKFPYFAQVKQDKVIYHSGKIVEGEILLEVNDQSVAGLTLYDLNNLIKRARDPVRFRTVKEGAPLVKDLKAYLSQRFNKNTVDHELQAAIRDNLYLRSLPCTTRKLREGEVDGVDYTFLTVEEFQELEKSGALLESGIYEGNYYGTPKPSAEPLSPSVVRRSNSANDLPGLHPSSDGKRKRNRSNIEQLSSSSGSTTRKNHMYQQSKDQDKKSLAVSTKEPQSSPQMTHAAETATADNEESAAKPTTMQESLLHSEKILGPLPEGWEMGQTESGDCYFIDHQSRKTSWLDPRLDSRARKNLEDCDDDELPYGWEKVGDSQFGIYYVDHIDKKTQYDNPVLEAKRKLAKAKEAIESLPPDEPVHRTSDNQTDPSLNNDRPYDHAIITDPSQLKGVSHLVPLEKSARGFGFTIVGGDDPKEFLQIKSVVPDGPAARTGNIQQGDIIAKVNDTCVLGWTHPEVVKLFQAIPIGQVVTLQLCRGYPLMVDANDPNTDILTTYAISPNDKPVEDFERQLRMLNSQLEQNGVDEGYYSKREGVPGMDLTSSPSKSMPDISQDQPYEQGYYGNLDPMQGAFLPPNVYGRSGSMGALPTPIVMQVITKKGDTGFGFTIADSPQGQKVKQILDASRCNELMEGDALLEINGTIVQNMPHNNVVQVLNDCPSNHSAIFVIQRGPLLMHDLNMAMGVRPHYINGPVPTPSQQFGYPQHGAQAYRGARMKRSQTEPGLGSENGSVVSAPPGSTLAPPGGGHPVQALLNEYRVKHNVADRGIPFNPPMSSAYQPYPGPQSLYQDPYFSQPGDDNYVEHTVVLRREETGFGFRILGGNTPEEPVTIGAIVPNGAADKEGSLQFGDELLTVDGERVTRISHNQVILLMGKAARNSVVQLGIRRRLPANQMINRPHRPPMNRPPVGVPQPRPVSRGPGGALRTSKQPFDIVVHRRQHEGFGFVIISSVKSPGVGLQAPHKIGRIIQGSPAARCGHLHVDDRVLAINNVDITHLHHGQIVNLIKDSGFAIALRVLPVAEVEADDSPAHGEGDFKVVELPRSKKGFGFGIRGGKEYGMPLYVLRVAPDGPAAGSGEVEVGDMLMEINGHSTMDIPHSQAINLIKQGGASVRLLLKRGNGNVPEIEPNQGSTQSLSSSAVSGGDQSARNRLMQAPAEPRAPPQAQPPKSPVKSVPFGMIQAPSKRSSRKSQSSVRKQRQRANSSGQVLPEDPNFSNVMRIRRAVTPNPTLFPKEVEVSPTGSLVGLPSATTPLDDLAKPSNATMPQPGEVNRSHSVKPKPQVSPKRKRAPPIPTAVSSPTSSTTTSPTPPSHTKENGTSALTNNTSPGIETDASPPDDSQGESPNDPEQIGDGKLSSGDDDKKNKSKKSKFAKATKVGLWLSPKKK